MVIDLKNWGIPDQLVEKVKKRDKLCAYCSVKLNKSPGCDKSTLEHIVNPKSDKPTPEENSEWNIVMCCSSCNSSKGAKKLSIWLNSDYCKKKKITLKTIRNKVVSRLLRKTPRINRRAFEES